MTTQLRPLPFLLRLLIAGLLLAGLPPHAAQAQATDATLRGIVTDEDGQPLPGATVQLENTSTGFSTGMATNLRGEYAFQQLPLGGPYTLTVTFVGYGEQRRSGYTINQGDLVRVNVQLDAAATEMEEVIVTGEDLKSRIDRLGAVTKVDQTEIQNLPTEGRNFTRLTSLSPLQGAGSINLGGQRRTSTNVTVDGVNARNQLTAGEIGRGPYTISQEAIREFEVSTNEYDVTQGRQAGGSINAVTKSGTNTFEGSAFVYHRADGLQSRFDIRGNRREEDFYTTQTGLSLGGPILENKLHFFAVYERQDAGSPQFIADIQGEDDESRIGITQDNLDRVIQIARDQYGLADQTQIGQFDRETTANTLFARVDWQINNRHRLTLRNNWNQWDSPFSVSDNSDIELAESFSSFSSMENSTLLSLRSTFSDQWTNEFKVQFQHAERDFLPSSQLPRSNIPRAIIEVESELPSGRTGNVDVQFGGQRFTPETNLERQLHFTNTSYFTLGRYDLTVGTDNMITYLETLLSNEQNGRFFFNSLEDFANENPARYAREVPLQGLPLVEQTVGDFSLFGQVDFNPHPDLNLVAGLRWDATVFFDAAAFNQDVAEDLGIRTDNRPADWNNIQPRLQLTWDVAGRNRDLVKLGGGFFSAQPHYYAQVNNIQNSGVLLGAIDVTGDDVPAPDFEAFRDDPSTVPGVPEGNEPFSTINAVSDDFEVPTTMKTNLSYTRFIGDRYSVGANLLVSRTFNNYVYQESNLVREPFFVTPQGREVFVPANTITEEGLTDWTQGRISNDVGRTLLLTSDGELDQQALVLEASARIGVDGYVDASFTFNRAKDNSSYNCCVANTSTFLPVEGDPRELNYGFSNNHFSRKLVVNAASPSWRGFTLGATAVGIGGTRYSLMVDDNTSANGDFNLRNDIAFIFDPDDPNTPQEIRDAYNEVLNDPNTADSFKDYLRDSFGGFAERNGGVNPFAFTIDLRLKKIFRVPGASQHGVELTADLFNVTNLLNRDWGREHDFRDRDFMRITGFDPATNAYNYSVITSAGNRPISGTPWRLQLGLKYLFN